MKFFGMKFGKRSNENQNAKSTSNAPSIGNVDVDPQLTSPFKKLENEAPETDNKLCNKTTSPCVIPEEEDTAYLSSEKQKQAVRKLRKLTEEGFIPLRVTAFFGGAAIVFSGLYGFQQHGLDGFSYNVLIITLFSWLAGTFIVLLEGRQFLLDSSSFHRFISNYLNILQYIWGRGIFYMIVGSLHICLGSYSSTIVGSYLVLIGFISFVIGLAINARLKRLLKPSLERHLTRNVFDFYDIDNDGFINAENFRNLINGLGIEEVDIEFEFDRLDADKDGTISFTEARDWVQSLNNTSWSILDYYDITGFYFSDESSTKETQ